MVEAYRPMRARQRETRAARATPVARRDGRCSPEPVVSEEVAGRGRRRVLGWAQGGCRVGKSIYGPSFRRELPNLGLDWAAREGRANQKKRG